MFLKRETCFERGVFIKDLLGKTSQESLLERSKHESLLRASPCLSVHAHRIGFEAPLLSDLGRRFKYTQVPR